MDASRTTDEWAQAFGEQIRDLRMDLDLEQSEVAERASISRPALHSLEAGRGSSLSTVIKVLRALDAVDWLATLHATSSEPSPLEILREEQARASRRSRVRKGNR